MADFKPKQLSSNYPFVDKIFKISDGLSISCEEIFNKVKRTLDSSDQFVKYLLWDVDDIQIYSIVPSSVIENNSKCDNYLYHFFYEEIIYSLIFGYFFIKDSRSEFKFYGTPRSLLGCYESFAIIHEHKYSFDPAYHETPWYNIRIFSKSIDLLTHIQTSLNISSVIVTCQECGISLSECSAGEIIITNPNIEFNNNPDSIECPICNNNIFLNNEQSRILGSIPVINNYYQYCSKGDFYPIPTSMKIFVVESLHNETIFKKYYQVIDDICNKYFKLSSKALAKVNKCFPTLSHSILDTIKDMDRKRCVPMNLDDRAQEAMIIIRNDKIEKLKVSSSNC